MLAIVSLRLPSLYPHQVDSLLPETMASKVGDLDMSQAEHADLPMDKTISSQVQDEKVEFAQAQAATAKEHSLTLSQALRAYPKAIMWSILLSSAVVMEGYDTLLVSHTHQGHRICITNEIALDWIIPRIPFLQQYFRQPNRRRRAIDHCLLAERHHQWSVHWRDPRFAAYRVFGWVVWE